MKTITFVRHAKSSWEEANKDDHERSLLPIGEKRTIDIANYIKEHIPPVELIISSTANRAKSTAAIFATTFHIPKSSIQEEYSLYEADPDNYLNIIYGLSNHFHNIIMVGHNPEITELVNKYLPKPIDYLATSGAVSIQFDTIKWEEIDLCSHNLLHYITPKKLKEQ